MMVPPKYILTPKITQLLQSIEGCREIINSLEIPKEIEVNIRRQSTLKSSLFSARIEGNTVTLAELSKLSSKDRKRIEVFNILKSINWIHSRGYAQDLTAHDILNLHHQVMGNLIPKDELGKFRLEVGAIFNAAGIAIYLPPRPSQIPSLIERLIKFINSSKEPFVPIRAALSHFTFEKIHPFLDGNGRVGRLLIQAVLAKGGYGMKGLLNIEEYLDEHRSEYYRALQDTARDVTGLLEFMLAAIATSAEDVKKQVLEKQQADIEDYLLPRRAEILNIIKDQGLVNFDTIKRRFMSVNERTLRYDLKKLQDAGLIRKRGTTKGVYYEPIKNSTTSPS